MSRIINRQRQLAEQGRLRLGYTVPAKTKDGRDTTRPVRSETWIITSHSKEHVETAATLWGGEPHEWEPMGNGARQWRVITTSNAIPAILPPGDPLNQSYEQWNRGGCVRRCNGLTEELSGSPCICLAQHGEQWYELSSREVCSSKSRLKVLLPDMPGLGSWRMETGSFYATDEIAGMVDTIRGAVGESVLVPVTLRIEPRTRVAGGETKQFVVPVVELRGVTAGALLSGQAIETRTLTTGNPDSPTPLALQAARPDYRGMGDAASTVDAVREVWEQAREAGHLTDELKAHLTARVDALKAGAGGTPSGGGGAGDSTASATTPSTSTPDVVDAELVPDPDGDADAVWAAILKAGGERGMTTPDIEDDFAANMGGLISADASAEELDAYLKILTTRAVA